MFGDLIISFFTKKKHLWGRPRRRLLRVAVASVAVALGLVALLCPDGTGKMRRDKGGIFQWMSHDFSMDLELDFKGFLILMRFL